MVYSRGRAPGMESIWSKFTAMGTRQTLVSAQHFLFAVVDNLLLLAGAVKSVLWYVDPLTFRLKSLRCQAVPQSSRRSTPSRNLLVSLAMFYYDFREDQ